MTPSRGELEMLNKSVKLSARLSFIYYMQSLCGHFGRQKAYGDAMAT